MPQAVQELPFHYVNTNTYICTDGRSTIDWK